MGNIFAGALIAMCLFAPLPIVGREWFNSFTNEYLGAFIVWIVRIFSQETPAFYGFYTDNIFLFVLFIFAAFLGSLFTFIFIIFYPKKQTNFRAISHVVLTYYLALVCLVYGVSKIFSSQFPVPEAHLLFTELAYFTNDILFWSMIGLNKNLQFFIGFIEICIAFLLLFRKTRLLGGFLFNVVFSQILIINLYFDISVKHFTILLILVNIFLFYKQLKQVLWLLLGNTTSALTPPLSLPMLSAKLYLPLKFLVVSSLVWLCVYPYLPHSAVTKETDTFLGAYTVKNIFSEQQQMPADLWPVKRFFILNYATLITENLAGERQAYAFYFTGKKMQAITNASEISFILDWQNFMSKGQIIWRGEKTYLLDIEKIAIEDLPVFQSQFHFFAPL